MRSEEVRRQVLDAIDNGQVPRGGPSELAAYGLLDDVPVGYWERWTTAAAARITDGEADR
jgi:hypothetical protein